MIIRMTISFFGLFGESNIALSDFCTYYSIDFYILAGENCYESRFRGNINNSLFLILEYRINRESPNLMIGQSHRSIFLKLFFIPRRDRDGESVLEVP